MPDIAKFGKLVIKMWFPYNLEKNLKDHHIVVGGSKNLKRSIKTFFGISFQKMHGRVLCYFRLSVVFDDLSHSERNEIASSTARNFNNS